MSREMKTSTKDQRRRARCCGSQFRSQLWAVLRPSTLLKFLGFLLLFCYANMLAYTIPMTFSANMDAAFPEDLTQKAIYFNLFLVILIVMGMIVFVLFMASFANGTSTSDVALISNEIFQSDFGGVWTDEQRYDITMIRGPINVGSTKTGTRQSLDRAVHML